MTNQYTQSDIVQLLHNSSFELTDHDRARIAYGRSYLEQELTHNPSTPLYGINTGFGALCDHTISDAAIETLQVNLIRSHACGQGRVLSTDMVRIIMLLKIISLCGGHSGVRVKLVQTLVDMYNHGIYPVILEQGSLGASGDLAPLAHLALAMIGEGEVFHQDLRCRAGDILLKYGIDPLTPQAKEGLALLNGTQFSTAHLLWSAIRLEQLIEFAHATATLSIEAFNCSPAPYDPLIHKVRNQHGQIESARRIRHYLAASDIGFRTKYSVQDPYSFRCIPQVYGASIDTLDYAWSILMREINGVTDNPNIFPDEDKILSGGNFHAQPIAYASDFLAIAAAEIGSLSERRTYQLICGLRDLPPFLSPHPGMNSGLMIPQYTAASIVSQNKQLCSPASVDSITSSAGQEDHVSMAANAGTKLVHVINNLESILCIEWLTAAQAFHFRKGYRISIELQNLYEYYRKEYVPYLDNDRYLHPDIESTKAFFLKYFVDKRLY